MADSSTGHGSPAVRDEGAPPVLAPGTGEGRAPEVLIVGAGPTGLLTACELLRRGVRIRLIDRAVDPMRVPKALSLWPRAMDIMDGLGLGDEVRRLSVRIDSFGYYTDRRRLARFAFPPHLAARQLPQYETERLLTEKLHSLGGRVERGTRLLCLDGVDHSGRIEPDGTVRAVLEHPDGRVEHLRVPFVVGADGASSTVRGQLGVAFEGSTYEMAFALIDTRIEGWLPPDEIRYYQSANGTLVVVPQPDGVFRFLSVMPREQGEMSVPLMQGIIEERGPRGVLITDPVWQTVFRVHARRAADFRCGRVFLVGDAAHVHSPAGGQGMNNGLQDAHNLGWKLAGYLRGDCSETVLLGYGDERAAVTRRIVRDTDVHTRAWMFTGPVRGRLRDLAFRTLDRTGVASRFYVPVMAGRRLAYPPARPSQLPAGRLGCTLPGRRRPLRVGGAIPRAELEEVVRAPGDHGRVDQWHLLLVRPPAEGPGARWSSSVHRLLGEWSVVRPVPVSPGAARELGLCARAGYHLLRPDGHIAAHGHPGDLSRLREELLAGPLPDSAREAAGRPRGAGGAGGPSLPIVNDSEGVR